LYDYFEETARLSPNDPFLGTRERLPDEDGKPAFGDYKWQTYQQTEEMVQYFS